MTYAYAIEGRDYARIDKLNTLLNRDTFYDDVRKLCKAVHGDHAMGRWQILSEIRKAELDEESRRENAMNKNFDLCGECSKQLTAFVEPFKRPIEEEIIRGGVNE